MMINVLALGAGVQSTTVYLMSCLGELPRLDCAIFANTGWEPQAVYKHLDWLETEVARKYGIPIHRVSCGRNIREDGTRATVRGHKANGERYVSMPLRTLSRDGQKGMLRRQCTREYKIEPIERFIKTELLHLQPGSRWPKDVSVRLWFGISADEFRRTSYPKTKPSQPAWWKSHIYPLCDREFFPDGAMRLLGVTPHTRAGCLEWCRTRGFAEPPRSACVGCPFRSDREWLELQRNDAEWDDAVKFDRAIRSCGGVQNDTFLHRNYVPLEDVKLKAEDDYPLFQCDDGVCGV